MFKEAISTQSKQLNQPNQVEPEEKGSEKLDFKTQALEVIIEATNKLLNKLKENKNVKEVALALALLSALPTGEVLADTLEPQPETSSVSSYENVGAVDSTRETEQLLARLLELERGSLIETHEYIAGAKLMDIKTQKLQEWISKLKSMAANNFYPYDTDGWKQVQTNFCDYLQDRQEIISNISDDDQIEMKNSLQTQQNTMVKDYNQVSGRMGPIWLSETILKEETEELKIKSDTIIGKALFVTYSDILRGLQDCVENGTKEKWQMLYLDVLKASAELNNREKLGRLTNDEESTRKMLLHLYKDYATFLKDPDAKIIDLPAGTIMK